MEILGSQIINGVATGSIYALVALGFILIYKATDVINFAQGEFVMASGFISYTLLVLLGLPYYLVFVLTVFLSGLMGVILERVIIRPIMNAPVFSIVIATIGISTILRSVGGLVFGYDVLPLPPPFSGERLSIGPFSATPMDLWMIASTLILISLLYAFFRFTRVGTAMRATAQNRTAASLMGVSVRNIFSLTWAISGALGGVAGFLIAPVVYLDPNLGYVAIKAFSAAILGGFGSVPGAIVGGMMIGVIENLSGYFFNAGIKHVSPYVIIILVLSIRPSGLFGVSSARKV